jgi:hypothetical protein
VKVIVMDSLAMMSLQVVLVRGPGEVVGILMILEEERVVVMEGEVEGEMEKEVVVGKRAVVTVVLGKFRMETNMELA